LGTPGSGEHFRKTVTSDVPTLFLSGALDARTPAFATDEIRAGFPNRSHLVVQGATHGDPLFLASPEIQTRILEFLRGEPVQSGEVAAPVPVFLK
jgi:pimeloyl-ACP methyl ester carboxylesterase